MSRYYTRKVFWENPYKKSLQAKILTLHNNEVIFDKTIAYSRSGGQESDKSTVNGIALKNSRIEGLNILYELPENHGFQEGDSVLMEIDWPRRNRLMRLHFACEAVLVLMNRLYGNKAESEELYPEEIDRIGPVKVGAHMAEDKARVDFKLSHNISSVFPQLLEKYNSLIDKDLAIETGYLNEELQRRYWRIPGFALIPCGGTHVRTTGEVGRIELKREKCSRGVERVRINLSDPNPTHPGEE